MLSAHDVFFVGVHCALEELDRRERERGDRFIGEGRSHLDDGVHAWDPYDFEIDTSDGDTVTHVALLIDALARRKRPCAFELMRSRLSTDTQETPSHRGL